MPACLTSRPSTSCSTRRTQRPSIGPTKLRSLQVPIAGWSLVARVCDSVPLLQALTSAARAPLSEEQEVEKMRGLLEVQCSQFAAVLQASASSLKFELQHDDWKSSAPTSCLHWMVQKTQVENYW